MLERKPVVEDILQFPYMEDYTIFSSFVLVTHAEDERVVMRVISGGYTLWNGSMDKLMSHVAKAHSSSHGDVQKYPRFATPEEIEKALDKADKYLGETVRDKEKDIAKLQQYVEGLKDFSVMVAHKKEQYEREKIPV